ncbi:MAG: hypothetical protein IMZ66_11795 [Planctomycetes bacterium]|nr:hypothetical protein [Planctomycetota bacterium]
MAFDAATALTRLAALDTAIDAFVAGGMLQSYTADGVTITVANFEAMSRYRDKVRHEAALGKIRGMQLADLGGG